MKDTPSPYKNPYTRIYICKKQECKCPDIKVEIYLLQMDVLI